MRRTPLLFLLLCGCQDYLFNQVCPEAIRESSIVVPALAPTPTDILFVVDNSGSMADEQENLAVNFGRFIEQIAGSGDYRIAVVTTDVDKAPSEWEGLQNFVYSPNYPNVLVDFSVQGCSVVEPAIDHGCFRGPDPSRRVVDSNTMDAQTQIAVFGDNVRVGSCGSGNEQALKAMDRALNSPCNAGFLRDTANLLVIIVSDEQDFDNTPVAQYVESLKAAKGGAAQIRVAAIVGYWDGRADDCSIAQGNNCGGVCDNEPPQGSLTGCTSDGQCNGGEVCINMQCNNPEWRYWGSCFSCSFYNAPDCCSAVGGGRYVEFALAMEQEIVRADGTVDETDCRGGGPDTRAACLIDTICQANFGETLAKIARDLIPRGNYNLNPPAKYPPGVNVTIKGAARPDGAERLTYNEDFTVSEDGSVLTIVGPKSPLDTEEIEIHFVVDSENRVEEPRGACQVSGSP